MGAPVDTGLENFEEAILKLSIADRARLIGWISETMVEEEVSVTAAASPSLVEDPVVAWPPADVRMVENPSGKPSWYDKVEEPTADLSKEEWSKRVNAVAGLWSDMPDDIAEEIRSARNDDPREINL